MEIAFSENAGRRMCWVLAAIDATLGTFATLFPAKYLALMHPDLPPGEYPLDWVARTGVLWLMFLGVQLPGALSPRPARWFLCAAVLRCMEVPADVAYGLMARGATPLSRAAILVAPVANSLAGAFLFLTYRSVAGERLSQTQRRTAPRTGT